jgi:uncharacterized protein YukE
VSTFGDVVQALIGSEGPGDGLDGSSAPVPWVGSRPLRIPAGQAWTSPDASGHGQVTVHRDVLRVVATGMRSDLEDLEGAVRRLDGIRHGEGISLTGSPSLVADWPTAIAFNGNASAAFTGVMQASQQTGIAHQDTSRKLAVSAVTYDQSESDNLRAARSVGTNLSTVATMVASYGSGHTPRSAALGVLPSYPVKARAVSGFSGAGMSASQIMAILHGLSPGDVQAAGDAHTALGTTLDRVAGRLDANARTLSQNWSGSAAQGAIGQFQQLHGHMVTLARQALQVGTVLSWLGGDVLPQFVSLPDPQVSTASLVFGDALAGTVVGSTVGGPVGGVTGGAVGAAKGLLDELDGSAQAAANRTAQEYIARLSGYLVIADQSLPDAIGAAPATGGGSGRGSTPVVRVTGGVPADGSGSVAAARPVGGGGNAVTLTGGRGAPVTGTGAAGLPGGPPLPSGPPSPSSLQGATIPGGPVPPPAGTTSTLSAVPSPPPSGPGGLGGGSLPGPVTGIPVAEPMPDPVSGPVLASDGASAVPATDMVSEELTSSVPPVGPGLVTAVASEQPVGTPGLSGASGLSSAGDPAGLPGVLADSDESMVAPEMAGFPMMGTGGAARPEEAERIRQAWLSQDSDIWGLPANLVPPVIDGPAEPERKHV